jgi:hypothetical protein
MPKLQEAKGRYHLAIPTELVLGKHWKKGQTLFLVYNERGNVEITDTAPRSKQ